MAMRSATLTPQVHCVPVVMERHVPLVTGGCLSRPNKLVGSAAIPGVGKVTRALEGYFRALRCSLPDNISDRLVVITGPIVQYDFALSADEAEQACESGIWFLWHKLPCHLRTLAAIGMRGVGPYIVVSVTVPAELAEAMRVGILKASQEKTSPEQVGSTPVHTRVDVLYDKCGIEPGPGGSQAALIAHKAAVHLLCAMMGAGRAVMVAGVGCPLFRMDADDEADDDGIEAGATGAVIENRVSEAEPRPLRESVEVTPLTDEQVTYRLERGITRPDDVAGADDVRTRVSTASIGPPIVPCNAPLNNTSSTNEMLGLSRHLSERKNTYTDKGRERFREAIAYVEGVVGQEFEREEIFKECKLPMSWSDTMKAATAEAAPFERIMALKGFVKTGELGLKPQKLPRLIGNPGPTDAEAQAEFVSIFEQYFCHAFPGFMVKGLNMRQTRDKLRRVLERAKDEDVTIASCDFSAMDSSWDLEEKQAVASMVKRLATKLIDCLSKLALARDPSDSEKIKWQFKTLTVYLNNSDAILFSGERGTSIYNRLLVLTLRTAEVFRHRGGTARAALWARARRYMPRSEGDFDIGDGDDTAFDARDYPDAASIVAAYQDYGKDIEPVLSKTAIEVLSTYVFLSAKGKFYALVKPKKNVERLCYGIRPTAEVIDGIVPPPPPTLEAEFATAAYQRAIACAQTPVVRQLALAVGDLHKTRAEAGGISAARLSADDQRRRPELAATMESLEELARTARDAVGEASCNGFVMEHWLLFGSAKPPPSGKMIEARAAEWMAADHLTSEVVITEEDLLNPEPFLTRCGWTQHVAGSLGVLSPKLLKCCPLGMGPPTATRPVRRDSGGKTPSSRQQTGGRGSESKAETTTSSLAHSSRHASGRPTGRTDRTGRSSRVAVAGGSNTDGVATVPSR